MIHFNAEEIGSYTYTAKDKEYRISIRSGNCDGVHIYTYEDEKGETWNQLFNFVSDREHLKNMKKNNHDIFMNCKNIRLNIHYKQNIDLMKYATYFGHEVICFDSKQ